MVFRAVCEARNGDNRGRKLVGHTRKNYRPGERIESHLPSESSKYRIALAGRHSSYLSAPDKCLTACGSFLLLFNQISNVPIPTDHP